MGDATTGMWALWIAATAAACGGGAAPADDLAPPRPVSAAADGAAGSRDAAPPPDGWGTVAALEAALAGGDVVRVVDVRLPDEHRRGHIPGAIPRAPHALRGSAIVRGGAPIWVVDDGLGVGRATRELAALRASGVSALLLDGGLAAWCRHGGPVVGDCRDADVVSAARFHEALGCERRVVFVLGAAHGHPEVAAALPPDATYAPRAEPERWPELAREALRRAEARHLLVLDGAGVGVAAAREALAPLADVAHVRFVATGAEGYARFLELGRPSPRTLRLTAAGATLPPEDCGCL